MLLNKEIKEMAIDFGADIVGVATIDKFNEIESQYKLKGNYSEPLIESM